MARPINPCKFRTEETRKKISDSIKRRYATDPEYRKKLSYARKGILPICLKPFIGMTGSKNPNWKGGITNAVTLIRKSRKYKTWVKSVLERDLFKCQSCEVVGGNLHAHHIISFSSLISNIKVDKTELYEQAMLYEPLWEIGNGMTLCVECHKKTPSYSKG